MSQGPADPFTRADLPAFQQITRDAAQKPELGVALGRFMQDPEIAAYYREIMAEQAADRASVYQIPRPFRLSDAPALFESIRKGEGRIKACRRLGVSYSSLQAYVKTYSDFADDLRAAELERIEACETRLFLLAQQDGDRAISLRASHIYAQWMTKKAAAERAAESPRPAAPAEPAARPIPTPPPAVSAAPKPAAPAAQPAPNPARRPKNPQKLVKDYRRQQQSRKHEPNPPSSRPPKQTDSPIGPRPTPAGSNDSDPFD